MISSRILVKGHFRSDSTKMTCKTIIFNGLVYKFPPVLKSVSEGKKINKKKKNNVLPDQLANWNIYRKSIDFSSRMSI